MSDRKNPEKLFAKPLCLCYDNSSKKGGNPMKKYIAECIGTFCLVFFGCGAAVAANALVQGFWGNVTGANIGALALAFSTLLIAFAFGLILLALVYAIGPVSGCHVNPAVSFGAFLAGRMSIDDLLFYVVAQFVGGIAGAAALWGVAGKFAGTLGANGFGDNSALSANVWRAMSVEMILTFVFVLVILAVTAKAERSGVAGVVIGLTLTVVHIVGIPFTGTSVNPARSFGPAFIDFLRGNQEPLSQAWLFLLAPLVGAAVAALLWRFVLADRVKKTAVAETVPAEEIPAETASAEAADSTDNAVTPEA